MGKKYSAIIFDLGGVLYDIDIQESVKAFKTYGLQNFDELYNLKEQTALFDALETGKIDENGFVGRINKLTGLNMTHQKIVDAWCALLIQFPQEHVKLLQALRQHYKLYLLSNTNIIHRKAIDKYMQLHFGLSGLAELFDKAYFSYELGLRKPGKEIYALVLEENGLRPQDCIFIDDNKDNIAAAAQLGIHSLLKDRQEPLQPLLTQNDIG